MSRRRQVYEGKAKVLYEGPEPGTLIQYFNVQPFIATLAMMFLGRGLASMLSTTPERLPDDSSIRVLATQIKIIDGPKVNDLIITPGVIIAILVVAASWFVLHRTRTGRTSGPTVSSAVNPGRRLCVRLRTISSANAG